LPELDQEIEDLVGEVVQSGLPSFMRVIPAYTMRVTYDEHGEILSYEQNTDTGKKTTFQPNQILHLVHPHSIDPIFGESSLQPITLPATNYTLIQQRQKGVLQGDASIDSIFVIQEASQDEVERFHSSMVTQHKNVGSPIRFLTMGNNVEYKNVSQSKDGDYLSYSEQLKQTIFITLGVPLSVAGFDVGGGLSENGDINYRIFIENTVRPLVHYLEQVFNNEILARYQALNLNYIVDVVLEDSDDQADLEAMYNMCLQNGTMTPNEVRAKRGMEPLEDNLGNQALIGFPSATTLEKLENPPEPPTPIIMQHPGAMPGQSDDQNVIPGDKTSSEGKEEAKKALQELVRTLRKAL